MMDSERFQQELMKGEKLRWTGQPDPSAIFTAGDIFLVPFSLVWGGFALVWEGGVTGLIELGNKHPQNTPPLPFALFGIPFVCIGLYFIFGRFLYKIWIKKRTWYAVTDKRIIIITDGFRQVVQSADIKSLGVVDKRLSGDRGSLIFGNVPFMMGAYLNSGMDFFGGRGLAGIMAFFDIPGAKEVDEMIRDIRLG
jgi:hypothetical protein